MLVLGAICSYAFRSSSAIWAALVIVIERAQILERVLVRLREPALARYPSLEAAAFRRRCGWRSTRLPRQRNGRERGRRLWHRQLERRFQATLRIDEALSRDLARAHLALEHHPLVERGLVELVGEDQRIGRREPRRRWRVARRLEVATQ